MANEKSTPAGTNAAGKTIRKVLSGINLGSAAARETVQSDGRPQATGLLVEAGATFEAPSKGFLVFMPEYATQSEDQAETGNFTLGSSIGSRPVRALDGGQPVMVKDGDADTHKVLFTCSVYAANIDALKAKAAARKALKAGQAKAA